MAKRTVKTPEKMEGGGADRVKLPGWYHFNVTHCLADVTPKGTPINGIHAELSVLGGQPEEGKSISATFFDPDPLKAFDPNSGISYDDWKESKDGKGWLMGEKKQLAFLVAVGLINEAQFGKELEYDTDDAVSRFLVAELVVDDRNADKGWLQINYANTYHIDDPRVADLVKQKKLTLSAGALAIYPKDFRRDPKGFDLEKLGGKASKAAGSNGSNGQHAKQQASNLVGAGAGAAAGGVDLNDI